ncbi:DnaJ domain-containing protein, partial [Macellibacteroides fermentans]
MNKYFDGCKDEQEIKARYRDLAKKYHPDLGGDLETMKAVN